MIMDYLGNSNWQLIGLLSILPALILFLRLKKIPINSQKILGVGIGFFIFSIIINIAGFTPVSDFFTVFGFVIITFALLLLLWKETNKLE